ncbi:hypothetical protein MZM54_04015 [[Brevibacterium] frigoritolerans]|nr:hypothetical protein [Peribacillus frigoritolerans]
MGELHTYLKNLGLSCLSAKMGDEHIIEEFKSCDFTKNIDRNFCIYTVLTELRNMVLIDAELLDRVPVEKRYKVEKMLSSVLIRYSAWDQSFIFELNRFRLYANGNLDVNIDEYVSYLNPSWEIQRIFINEEDKRELIHNIMIEKVKEIVEERKILNKMRTEIPQLVEKVLKERMETGFDPFVVQ